jgi:kynurenine formamidase
MRITAFVVAVLIVSGLLVYSGSVPKEKLLDMSFTFDKKTIYWPTANPFHLKEIADGKVEGGWYYRSNDYCASEHGGTHVDAPSHFDKAGPPVDEIPLHKWIGPAVNIDVTAKCDKNRDYLLTVQDIKNWEKKYGKIPSHAWVIMYTGIDTRFYPDREKVLGTTKTGPGAVAELHFPGFSPESVSWLLKERDIAGIAIDTPSIDYGQSKDFKAHQILCAANKPAVENIANLDKLPPTGATLYVLPMKIKGGSGAPARIFAILP